MWKVKQCIQRSISGTLLVCFQKSKARLIVIKRERWKAIGDEGMGEDHYEKADCKRFSRPM